MRKLADVLLILVFLAMMLVGFSVLLAAFGRIRHSHTEVLRRAAEAQEHLLLLSRSGKTVSPEDGIWVERVADRAREGLDSSTISFLFEFMSLILVSAGVYLLSRCKENIKNSERNIHDMIRKVQLTGPFVSHWSTAWALDTYLSAAYHISCLLKIPSTLASLHACLRQELDYLKSFYGQLSDAKRTRAGIHDRHHFLLVNLLGDTIINLRGACPSVRTDVEPLIRLASDCMSLFRESDFVGWYNEHMNALLNKDFEYRASSSVAGTPH